jgi:hypothetical protein
VKLQGILEETEKKWCKHKKRAKIKSVWRASLNREGGRGLWDEWIDSSFKLYIGNVFFLNMLKKQIFVYYRINIIC